MKLKKQKRNYQMPNIALLNYCNLSCPYCFANEFIEEKKQYINLEQLNLIFDFLKKTPNQIKKIGLIGGEPTLHPNFKEILKETIKFCQENMINPPLVFSNGILIEQYAKFFVQDAKLLLNLNEPELINKEKYSQILASIKKLDQLGALEKNVTFGINIYPNIKNYNYIFELASKYNQSFIRCSYVAPTKNFCNNNQDEYYINGKQLFLDLCDTALEYDIKLHLDCNHIPLCYFSEKEQQKIKSICTGLDATYCGPVIDITPDFKATCCFGAYNLVDLNNFNNLEEVYRYFTFEEIYPRIKNNNSPKCQHCNDFKYHICQGGCLGFVNK